MQCASVLFYWESRQIFVHDFFGQDDPAIITDGYQNAQRLHTFFRSSHATPAGSPGAHCARSHPTSQYSPAVVPMASLRRWGEDDGWRKLFDQKLVTLACRRTALRGKRHSKSGRDDSRLGDVLRRCRTELVSSAGPIGLEASRLLFWSSLGLRALRPSSGCADTEDTQRCECRSLAGLR
jgi:hypothetical protein